MGKAAPPKRRRKQGVVSWITSVISLVIGLSGVFTAFAQGGVQGIANRASFGMVAGGPFNLAEGASIYVPMIAGIVFKKIAAELTKAARISTLIPRLG